MARAPYVFPIVGGRKVEHLEANIKSLEIRLTAEEIKTVRQQPVRDSLTAQLNNVMPLELGFPYEPPFGRDPTIDHAEPSIAIQMAGVIDYVQTPKSLSAP